MHSSLRSKFFHQDGESLDVLLITAPLLELEDRISSLPSASLSNTLIVCMSPLLEHPSRVLLSRLPPDADVIVAHPMFGPPPEDGKGVDGLPFVYSKVRVRDQLRADRLLSAISDGRCKMSEMSPTEHDEYTASSQFCTKLFGNLLAKQDLVASPVNVPAFESLVEVMDAQVDDAFDDFYSFYKMCPKSSEVIGRLRDSLGEIERKIAAKSSYIEAKREMREDDRKDVMDEVRRMLRDIENEGGTGAGKS